MKKYFIEKDILYGEITCIEYNNSRLLFPWDPARYNIRILSDLRVIRLDNISFDPVGNEIIAREKNLYEFEDDHSALLFCEVL